MRLQRLVLRDFKGFAELDLGMAEGPCTLLIGANGSGKSSVVEALQLLFEALMADAASAEASYVPTPDDIRRGASTLTIGADLSVGQAELAWSPDAAPDAPVALLRVPDSWGPHVERASELPLFIVTRTARSTVRIGTRELEFDQKADADLPEAWRGALWEGIERFGFVIPWVRREENLENEVRLRSDPAYRRPSLEAARRALTRFMSALEPQATFSDPRISRVDPVSGPVAPATDGTLVIDKDGIPLTIDQLSDGERFVLVFVCDVARRLWLANPNAADPLAGSGMVVIDEVEQHLHPAWQLRLLPALVATFPGLQFIATTHSPSVVTSVPGDAVRLLEGFRAHPIAPTYGRDANSLLEHVFGAAARPREVEAQIGAVVRHIDDDALPEARADLDGLARLVSEDDPEVVRLRTLLSFLAS